jgi:ATP-dependent helicase HrpA
MSSLDRLELEIATAMRRDQYRLRKQLRALRDAERSGKPVDRRLGRLASELTASAAICEARRQGVPRVSYDDDLPISARRAEIAKAIAENQVVIVSGETGSGKSTQLPKICLEAGRGIAGLIGHTQPRRIAARALAARIAEELGSPLGRDVGFKIRFAEALGPQVYVKLMTDGILLAESQGDPFFDQYDTIIIDEAHERSLNIDFLIGYLKRLLPRRPELKLIITSATIDSARFSRHFSSPASPAPIVEVSGRTYPVDMRYRPLPSEDDEEPDLQQAVMDAIDELGRTEGGDILVFMPTERDIHETAKSLRGRPLPGDPSGQSTEILPLYARLSIQEQQRVFHPGQKRRIVIATNVAESSLTVPRIRCVIDPGTARISRYSPRSKTQRLPIEAVSRASADQRAGRCGRIGPGVCVRLFGEEDYLARDRFTDPEIQRTNLAAVILQTKALGLGDIEQFPFLDPPRADAVRDGYRTLFELGGFDEHGELTEIGRRLSRLPVDPRIGRMILAADEENCLREVLIIAATLESQDPRERPLEKQEAADACHAKFSDEHSDFLAFLKIWDFCHHLKSTLSRNQFSKACRQNFLSGNRVREWLDVHRELVDLVEKAGLKQHPRQDDYEPIHRAILSGLLSSLALRGDANEYTVAGGGKANLWPGAGIFRAKPKWIVAAEVVETSRRYLRCCARVDPRWIESLAGHLVKRTYSEPRWDRAAASAMALERVSLFGLTIIAGRSVRFGPIDPDVSRQLLIQHGLVEGDLEAKPDFLLHNERLLDEVERLQSKLRRHDLLLGPWARYEFYDRRIPADVYDGTRLNKWIRESQSGGSRLLRMSQSDLVREDDVATAAADFPDTMPVQSMELGLDYQFAPGAEDDGVNLNVPLDALNQVDARQIDWLVPGLLEKKVLALIRSLPKSLRTQFVPAPEAAQRVTAQLRFGEGDFYTAVAAALSRLGGTAVGPDVFQRDRLPNELQMNICVTDTEGKPIAAGRDLDAIRRDLGLKAAQTLFASNDPQWTRDGLLGWDFDQLPEEVETRRGALVLKAYPALLDEETSVSLRLVESPQRAAQLTHAGLLRLFFIAAGRELKTQVDWLPNLDKLLLWAASLPQFDVRRQLAELLADRAFVADLPVPRTKDEFQQRLAEGRGRIGMAVQEVAGVAAPLLESYHQARLALEQAKAATWQYAIDDARDQLARLVGPRFLVETPWPWLRHLPRFLRAVRFRLDNLGGGGLARDRRNFEEFSPRWQAYLERAEQHAARGLLDPELLHFRWMLEEYRVSLFAQKLGTSLPVSAKRLDRQWMLVSP